MLFTGSALFGADLCTFVALHHNLPHTSYGGGRLWKNQHMYHALILWNSPVGLAQSYKNCLILSPPMVLSLQSQIFLLFLSLSVWNGSYSPLSTLSSSLPVGVATTQSNQKPTHLFIPPWPACCVHMFLFSFFPFFPSTPHCATWAWSR